jgi:hypothetical protein
MFIESIRNIIQSGNIKWQKHALERMLERDIYRSDVIDALENGEIIESYTTDQPFPSVLILGFNKGRPLHVVISLDTGSSGVILLLCTDLILNILKKTLKQENHEE